MNACYFRTLPIEEIRNEMKHFVSGMIYNFHFFFFHSQYFIFKAQWKFFAYRPSIYGSSSVFKTILLDTLLMPINFNILETINWHTCHTMCSEPLTLLTNNILL